MGCTINGSREQKINPGHGWLQTPGGLEPGPGRVGTGKGAASRGGRGNPAGAHSGNPTEAGQVGGRPKRAEMPPSADRPGKKRCGPTQKKRRHERSIVRAGRPVTQLVSAGATPCTGAGRKPVERIPLFYENTTQNGTPRMPWGNYPAHRGLPAGRFSRRSRPGRR
jgi:hypothetical protein